MKKIMILFLFSFFCFNLYGQVPTTLETLENFGSSADKNVGLLVELPIKFNGEDDYYDFIERVDEILFGENSVLQFCLSKESIHFNSFLFKFISAAQTKTKSLFESLPNEERLENMIAFPIHNKEYSRAKAQLLKASIDIVQSLNKQERLAGWQELGQMIKLCDLKNSELGNEFVQRSPAGLLVKRGEISRLLKNSLQNENNPEIKKLVEKTIHLSEFPIVNDPGKRKEIRITADDLNNIRSDSVIIARRLYDEARKTEVVTRQLELYTQALQYDSLLVEAFINRGVIYYDIGQLERAIGDFTTASQINSQLALPKSYLGLANLKKENYQVAISYFDDAIRIDSNSIVSLSNRGLTHQRMKNYQKAVDDFSRALAIDSLNINVLTNRGVCYANLSQLNKAQDDFLFAISVDPENAVLYYNQGNLYLKRKQWKKAINFWEKCIELDHKYNYLQNKIDDLLKNKTK